MRRTYYVERIAYEFQSTPCVAGRTTIYAIRDTETGGFSC